MIKLAVIYLILPDGRIVFQRRTEDAPTSPGLLGFFGGHMEKGETPLQAVKREVGEETSLAPDNLNITFVGDKLLKPDSDFPKERHSYYFKGYTDSAEFEVFEGVRAEVFSMEDAINRADLTEGVRKILQEILKEK